MMGRENPKGAGPPGRCTAAARPAQLAGLLFQALGIQPDWDKLRYCVLLDELF